MFTHGSRNRLTRRDLPRFASDSLFDRVARAVCTAGCLPRKELYEAWEVARRTRRLFRGRQVIDVAGGHGLLAHLLLLLDDTSPSARVVDPVLPASHRLLMAAMVDAWPRLGGRIVFEPRPCEGVTVTPDDLVVSSHACGALTDAVIACATSGGAALAVLPCCHDFDTCDRGAYGGWVDGALAIDLVRVGRLERAGYRVWTQTIPVDITPRNRLLIAAPLVSVEKPALDGPGTDAQGASRS